MQKMYFNLSYFQAANFEIEDHEIMENYQTGRSEIVGLSNPSC
jgi:hypothetical protein